MGCVRVFQLIVAFLPGVLLPWTAQARCSMTHVADWLLEADLRQPVTRGTIDGAPVRVLIDTGSSVSFLWRTAAERIGLRLIGAPRVRLFGLGGESRISATVVDEFQVQSFSARHLRLPVAGDLPSAIDVVFGEDFLGRHSVEFDLREQTVRMMDIAGCTPSELPYWSKTYSMAGLIASPREAGAIRVNVLINGRTVRAQIDSGSSATLLSKSVADAVGVGYRGRHTEVAGIGWHMLPTWVAEVHSFQLGDESIRDTRLRVAELGKFQTLDRVGSRIPSPTGTEPEMLLGMDFLRTHRILIDNASRTMVFTYQGGPVFETAAPEPRLP